MIKIDCMEQFRINRLSRAFILLEKKNNNVIITRKVQIVKTKQKMQN